MSNIPKSSSSKISNFWWLTLTIGIVYTIVGILMLRNPLNSFYTLCVIAGIPLIISGIFETYLTIVNRKKMGHDWLVFSGLIDLGIGLILVSNPKFILILVTLLISLLLIYQAVIIIRKAVQIKTTNPKGWKWMLGSGILLIILTAILIVKPEIVGAALSVWLGITFMVFGFYRIFLFFRMK